ncbi:hypothetical protein C8F04DRAFT_1079043 [Mycena alexandri]|uniref:DUF6534 domain-containing protein n=1 Tax=Mycena alexandri TaxID=1745969 RepID=A0AAD6T9S2_9AGAR|nr:hypothetical protein C8F04DRAFT_1079043 [Mycena alexandri]
MSLPHHILDAEASGPTFEERFAPAFWGFSVSLLLFGVTTLQGYLYFTHYNDKLWVGLLAGGMITLDFISMGLISQSMYHYILPQFGSFAPLSAITPELTVECLISALLTFASQTYFAYQLFMIRRPGIVAKLTNLSVVILGTVGLGSGIGFAAMMFMFPEEVFANRNHTLAILAGISKGFAAAANIVATIAMCSFLTLSDTGLAETSNMLDTIMHFFVNRAVLVTVAQIGLLVTFFATSNHLWWLAFHIPTTKLYVTTFFAMLNARSSVPGQSAPGQVSSMIESANRGRGSAIRYAPHEKPEQFGDAYELDSPRLGDRELDSPRFAKGLESPRFANPAIYVTTTSTTAEI